jgi:hypothetical protein
MMQQRDGYKLKRTRIVDERRANIKLINYPGWVITRSYEYPRTRTARITFAVKLG